jgi:hypothetical protein
MSLLDLQGLTTEHGGGEPGGGCGGGGGSNLSLLLCENCSPSNLSIALCL